MAALRPPAARRSRRLAFCFAVALGAAAGSCGLFGKGGDCQPCKCDIDSLLSALAAGPSPTIEAQLDACCDPGLDCVSFTGGKQLCARPETKSCP